MKWFELDQARLEVEKRLLARFYPGCRLQKQNNRLSVHIQVRTAKRCYQLKGIFPDRFPYSPMIVVLERPKITDCPPHYFTSDGALCIYGDENYGPETTAKVYLDWAKQWIKYYEHWQRTGNWKSTNGR